MINFNETTIKDVDIKSDRFGMAAISTIFKAFGDNIRSKEYWPWSERIGDDWIWEKSQGYENDLNYAIELIKYALWRIENEEEAKYMKQVNSSDQNIKDLKRRLNRLNKEIETANNITDAINRTSAETKNETELIENLTNYD